MIRLLHIKIIQYHMTNTTVYFQQPIIEIKLQPRKTESPFKIFKPIQTAIGKFLSERTNNYKFKDYQNGTKIIKDLPKMMSTSQRNKQINSKHIYNFKWNGRAYKHFHSQSHANKIFRKTSLQNQSKDKYMRIIHQHSNITQKSIQLQYIRSKSFQLKTNDKLKYNLNQEENYFFKRRKQFRCQTDMTANKIHNLNDSSSKQLNTKMSFKQQLLVSKKQIISLKQLKDIKNKSKFNNVYNKKNKCFFRQPDSRIQPWKSDDFQSQF